MSNDEIDVINALEKLKDSLEYELDDNQTEVFLRVKNTLLALVKENKELLEFRHFIEDEYVNCPNKNLTRDALVLKIKALEILRK